jgi:hypothetical protein
MPSRYPHSRIYRNIREAAVIFRQLTVGFFSPLGGGILINQSARPTHLNPRRPRHGGDMRERFSSV